jgi:hypothetical protein
MNDSIRSRVGGAGGHPVALARVGGGATNYDYGRSGVCREICDIAPLDTYCVSARACVVLSLDSYQASRSSTQHYKAESRGGATSMRTAGGIVSRYPQPPPVAPPRSSGTRSTRGSVCMDWHELFRVFFNPIIFNVDYTIDPCTFCRRRRWWYGRRC